MIPSLHRITLAFTEGLPGDGPRHVVSETFRRAPNLDVPRMHMITLTLGESKL